MQKDGPPDASSIDPLAAFDGVCLRDEHDGHPVLQDICLSVHPGRALHICVEDDFGSARRLADLLCGIRHPDRGRVCAFGRDWTACAPREAADLRARIGRVFSGVAWLSNLDMDENLLLAARHHAGGPDSGWRERAEAWAVRFGLDRLPEGRPAWIDERTSQIAQWVRAFLLDPELLVLQDPLSGVPHVSAEALAGALAERCERGAAVVWFARRSSWISSSGLPGRPIGYRLRAGRLVSETVLPSVDGGRGV